MEKIKWKKAVERRHPPIFMDFLIHGQFRDYMKNVTGLDCSFNVKKMPYSDEKILGRKYFGTLYFDTQSVEDVKRIVKENIASKGILFLKDYISKCYVQADSFLQTSRRVSEISGLRLLTNEEISKLFEKYAEEAFKMSSFLLTIIGVQFVLEEKVEADLRKILALTGKSSLFEDMKRKLSVPIKKTPEIESVVEILKLAAEVQKDSELSSIFKEKMENIQVKLPQKREFYEKVKNYVEKFAWIQPMYYRGKPLEVKDVILQIRTLLRRDCVKLLEKTKEKEEKALAEKEKALAELNPPEDFVHLIEMLQEFLYLRTYRLEVFFMANQLVMKLLEEIARRLKVSYDDVLFLRCEEITSSLRNKKYAQKEIIEERKKGYAVIKVDNTVKWYSGKDLLVFLASEPPEELPENEVRGMVAWPGRVVGKAKLILSNEDMEKMEEGDILVTTMTTPSLMPAIQKAGGIVTNEGGILSHAAIVSREFGIPCIIGTEYATYVFKDGDLIEIYGDIDSNFGIVRKLKE